MNTCRITIMPDNNVLHHDSGTLLMDILEEAGVPVIAPCGGRGNCGKCAVKAEGKLSQMTDAEIRLLGANTELRLACQARVLGDVTVYIESIDKKAYFEYPEADPASKYGIAVDIGTTSVQISMTDLGSGDSFMIDSFLNPQRRFGHDVVARISSSTDTGTNEKLIRLIRSDISNAITGALKATGIPGPSVKNVVLSGNTTMLYYLFGIDVQPLGVHPYLAETMDFSGYTPADIGLDLPDKTEVYAFPVASAYLGGDFTGGLALIDRLGHKKNTFFIDLGTNGEMFLRNSKNRIYATSCAMGPALEGMNISCGMTAGRGAVNHIWTENKALYHSIIKSPLATGICGTGIIDAIAIMIRDVVLLKNGAFNKYYTEENMFPIPDITYNAEEKSMYFTDRVYISQKDIRNIQLAKGASLSASEILLKEAGCDPKDIEHVFIAGAFGENLNIQNFRTLRFIPNFPAADYTFLGNTSLKAAETACREKSFRKKAAKLRSQVQVVELSDHPDFNDTFMKCLDF